MTNDDHASTATTPVRPEPSTATQSDLIAASGTDAAIRLDVADRSNPELAIPRHEARTTAAPLDEATPAHGALIAEDATAIIPAIRPHDERPPTTADQTAIIPAIRPNDERPPATADQTAIIPAIRPHDERPPATADQTAIIPAIKPDNERPPRTADQTAIIPAIRANLARVRPSGSAKLEVRPSRLGRAPMTLAASATGVLIVAFAYAGGRSGASWSTTAFWIGQFVVFAPVAARCFFGRLAGSTESFVLVVGLAVMQYMQKWLYSPDQFKFPDELQHWHAATILVESGRLFQPNRSLPVAVHFPGLEVMTSAVVGLTGLSVTQAGLIIAGVAHLAFIAALFATIRRAGGSPEIAGAACIIYATALHYVFFDSMFIYQTAALPFMMLAIWASRLWRPRDRANWPAAVLIVFCMVATTASHHVTAGALVGTLALIGVVEVIFARPRRWATLVMAAGAAVIVAIWFVAVAPEVFSYLDAPLRGMVSGLEGLLGGGNSSGSGASGQAAPFWQLAVQALGLLALLLLLIRASLAIWRAPGRLDPWQIALLVGSFVFFASTGARFLGARGPELAGRASTFAYIPISIVAAGVLVGWRPRPRGPRLLQLDRIRLNLRVPPIVHGTAIALLLMLGARVGGWPPVWDALPGPYLASGYERAVDRQGVSAAIWARNWLGTDRRVAADLTGVTLISTYGRQDPVGEASQLFYDTTWKLSDELLLQTLGIDYLWVDTRLTTQVPVSGSYFPVDPQNGKHLAPMPAADIAKFDGVAGINRYYDNGSIRIYDMRTA